MYVCICNALRDSQIAKAAQNGAGTVDQAYAALGCRTQCGQCREDAEAVIACTPRDSAGYGMLQAAE